MQTTLATVALLAAVVGLIYSHLTTLVSTRQEAGQRRPRQTPWPLLIWFAALVLVGFLAMLSSRPPFSPGLTLGWGFLIGGVVALYGVFEADRSFEGAQWLTRGIGLLSAAVFGVSLVLLIFRGYPNEALVGYALAAILAAGLWRACISPQRASEAVGERPIVADIGTELFALSAVTLALGARLGIEHFARGTAGGLGGGYWVLPALLAAIAALATVFPAQLTSEGPGRSDDWRSLIPGWIATAVAAALAFGLASKLGGTSGTALTFLCGAVGFAIAAWLALGAHDRVDSQARPVSEAFGVALLSLAVAALSFKLLHGYGEALALSGGLAIVVLLTARRAASSRGLAGPLLTGGFVVLLLLALYRLFLEKNGLGHPFDFQQHYNSFSLVLGALSGFALLTYGQSAWQVVKVAADRTAALSSLMGRAALLGIAAMLTPLILVVLWGLGAVGSFLIGLVIAELSWMLLVTWATGEDRAIALAAAPHAYLVAMSLVAIQFSSVVLSFGDASRWWKALIVIAVLLAGLAWAALRAPAGPARGAQGGGGAD